VALHPIFGLHYQMPAGLYLCKLMWHALKLKNFYGRLFMITKLLKTLVATSIAFAPAAAMAGSHSQCSNDTWNKVMSRGKLVVGVKADYKPWGYRDSSGEIVGIVGPNYYTSGTNIMSPKALGLKNWEDLRGKPVCGKQGAFYNQIVEERYGAKIIAFTGNAEAKQALRDKKCIAWVYDDSSIGSDLSSGNWDEFEMPLNSEDDNPWALAVPSKERNCVFGRFMAGMQYQWHQDGSLIALEKKWGIKPTQYLVAYNERMKDWLAD
jgi:polar amino acid transport system substrate-binding protein